MNQEDPNIVQDGLPEQEPVAVERAGANPEDQEKARLEAMEEGQIERAGLCRRILQSEIVSNGLDFVPVAGSLKLVGEGLVGDTLTGKELSGKDRIIRTAVGAAMTVADFTGWGEAADAFTLVGKSTMFIGRAGKKLAEKGAEKGAAIFAKTAEFMSRHPEIVQQAEALIEAKVRAYAKGKVAELQQSGNA